MSDILYKNESYRIIGRCLEVYNNLGSGFLEVVYKDALEYEFRNSGISFEREKEYKVMYKRVVLPHKFYADFVVFDKIILEVKATTRINDYFIASGLNYMKVSGNKLCLITNFGEESFRYKRIVL
jgi:GxxExxY protein